MKMLPLFEVPLKWAVKVEKPDFIGKKALTSRIIDRKLLRALNY